MLRSITPAQWAAAANTIHVDVPTLRALAAVESQGAAFARDGFPIILFEGHHFHRHTGGRFSATHQTISYPKWTKQHYGKTQAQERVRLETAVTLDRDAALMSASWGAFQIMGSNFPACGCSSVQVFVNAMCRGEFAQLQLLVQFILSDRRLLAALQRREWAEVARRYNGPGYEVNRYDVKLAAAYERESSLATA